MSAHLNDDDPYPDGKGARDKKGRIVLRAYLNRRHLDFIRNIAGYHALSMSEVLRRLLDEIIVRSEQR